MMLGLYGVIDGLFIGNAVGDVGLSAINIAWPIPAVIMALGVGIGIGGSVLISHSLGENNSEKAGEIFHTAVTMLFCTSAVVTVVLLIFFPQLLVLLGTTGEVYEQAYNYCIVVIIFSTFQIIGSGIIPTLRNFNMPTGAMICMIVGTVLNVIINYILVLRLDFGVMGAAIGTVVSQFVVCIIAFSLLRIKANLTIKFKLDRQIVLKILKIALTAFGISMAPSVTLMITNWQSLAYGGASVVACYAVIAYIIFPAQSMATGIGEGVQPLMSYYKGANDEVSLKKVVIISRVISAIFSIVLTFGVIIMSPYIGGWFGLSDSAKEYFPVGVTIYALALVLVSFAKFNLSYLNSTLQTKQATFLTYAECIFVTPTLLFLLPLIWGVTGIWLSAPIASAIMIIIFFALKIKRR